jgi:lipopolysaccharide biosynthesis regulator YciM
MMKPTRNDPCPCGSGKKYKKCCLATDEAEALKASSTPPVVETDLDSLSNSVLDFIAAGDIKRAEDSCHALFEQFPDQVDGHLRLAEVHKAKAEWGKAVEQLRKAADFMEARHKDYDPEMIQSVRNEADGLERNHARA